MYNAYSKYYCFYPKTEHIKYNFKHRPAMNRINKAIAEKFVQRSSLTLIWVEGIDLPTPASVISLNNSKTLNAVTLEFWIIQLHSIRDIHAKFGIHNLSQSPDIGQNSDGGIFDFRISGQCLTKENCHNSRTTDDIDMDQELKLTRETKQRHESLTMTSCRKIVTSSSFSGFLANLEQSRDRIPDIESAKVMFLVTITFCRTKTENRTKKPLTQLSHYCFE